MKELPDGLYPFIDRRLPLADMVMVEAPPDLEALFKSQAAANGIQLSREFNRLRRAHADEQASAKAELAKTERRFATSPRRSKRDYSRRR